MNRTEALTTVKEINEKLEKVKSNVLLDYNNLASIKIVEAQIWLSKFGEIYCTPTDAEYTPVEELATIEDIHNTKGQLSYKIQYLKNIAERLGKYAIRQRDPLAYHTLTTAIDKLVEAIAFLERSKKNGD